MSTPSAQQTKLGQPGAQAVLDYESPDVDSQGRKLFRAGTLIYTTGGLVVLFCWLLWGDFAWSMKERAIAPVVPLILKKLSASDFLTALLVGSLPAAIGVVLGPIISYRSDRHRGRWGRRIPFLAVTTPIAALAMICLAYTPAIGPGLHRAIGSSAVSETALVLALFGTCWTVFEFATVAANAVFGGLINDVVPRQFLGRFFGLFRALSLIAGMIFNFWLLGKAEVHYVMLFVVIGTLYGVGFLMMCLKVKEGDYPPPPPAPPSRGFISSFSGGVKTYFRDCFTNPYYIWVFVGMTLAQLAFIPVNLFSVYYAKSVNMGMGVYGKYIALTYGISLMLSYLLGILSDRFHPLRMSIASLALYALSAGWGMTFALDARTFGIGLVAHGVLSGCYFTTSASLGQRLFPKDRFAQFASAQAMLQAIGTVVLGPSLGRFLDWAHHAYRYTFTLGLFISIVGVITLLIVHAKFMHLGGPRHYVAPEEPTPRGGFEPVMNTDEPG